MRFRQLLIFAPCISPSRQSRYRLRYSASFSSFRISQPDKKRPAPAGPCQSAGNGLLYLPQLRGAVFAGIRLYTDCIPKVRHTPRAGAGQPLTAPDAMPSTISFTRQKYSKTIGTAINTLPAANLANSVSSRLISPTATV